MAKSTAQILAGEDMEGGENFCDGIYNALKNHFYGAAAPGSPENGTMYLADDGFTYIYFDTVWYKLVGATGAAWTKTIGATGDYATWAAMIAEMPDMIAHAVTVTIETGTTLTELCPLKNKHGLTNDAVILITAEDYFPQAAILPTATGATPTTLVDAGQAWAGDRWIDCWVLIVDGTGTDNDFVKITDSDGTSITVAVWPGTQPDATSRYMIVGALIDAEAARATCMELTNNSVTVRTYGIGMTDATWANVSATYNNYLLFYYCASTKCDSSSFYLAYGASASVYRNGIVGNNTSNAVNYGGISCVGYQSLEIGNCGISDNLKVGFDLSSAAYCGAYDNFGDGNGQWGGWAHSSAQCDISGTECSGAGGNHSDPGTAGAAASDQAAIY